MDINTHLSMSKYSRNNSKSRMRPNVAAAMLSLRWPPQETSTRADSDASENEDRRAGASNRKFYQKVTCGLHSLIFLKCKETLYIFIANMIFLFHRNPRTITTPTMNKMSRWSMSLYPFQSFTMFKPHGQDLITSQCQTGRKNT